MLRSIDPLLTPELLFAMASMGHGDDLVVCDANFPAGSTAASTTHQSAIALPGVNAPTAVRAILSLFPLDEAVEKPVLRMEVKDAPDELPRVQLEVIDEVSASDGRPGRDRVGSLERFAFYEAAKRSYAVVWTGERRFYGCFVFKKGVISPSLGSTPNGPRTETA
jgi:L-fucose mutarotase